jgi:carbon monoxide dehydrogenase subunit G
MQPFAGERVFALPPDQLWPKMRDAAFLATCIPDGTPHDGATRDRAVCTVHPGFSFMRGSLDVTIEIIDGDEPKTLRYSQKSKGIGSSSEVVTALTLEPHEGGTKIAWTAEVKTLGGLLKAVPSGLIRGAAQRVIEDVWGGVAAKLSV